MKNIILGKAVSVKMQKTVVVLIERKVQHRLYKKIIRKTKKIKAHNENFDIDEGDLVKIAPARPVSKDKHFKVIEVVKK